MFRANDCYRRIMKPGRSRIYPDHNCQTSHLPVPFAAFFALTIIRTGDSLINHAANCDTRGKRFDFNSIASTEEGNRRKMIHVSQFSIFVIFVSIHSFIIYIFVISILIDQNTLLQSRWLKLSLEIEQRSE